MIGRQISHFYIIRTLGSGGMGIVYEAQDTRLPRSVAIKFLKSAWSSDVDALRRFKREARLASSLNHPNICTVLDVDEGNGQAFIAMELLQGRSLKSRLAGEPLALAEILDIAGQIADALAVAHDHGIIHRDVTPGNVFLTDDGFVKLLDFGLARHFPSLGGSGDSSDSLTTPGSIAGTIHYMAPEQLVEDASVDYRCDLFSLGVLLYQMATGARPFDIAPRSALIAMIRQEPHVPLRQLTPRHPSFLEHIVDVLLAKRPDDRYQTARAFRVDLDRVRPSAHETAPRAATDGRPSIAVLPFHIVGTADTTSEQLRDGLAEDISQRLSAVRDLRIAPRTSTRALNGQSLREIGRSLGVTLVLEGSIQCTDRRVRVTATLVDAADECAASPTLRVERGLEDPLTAQDEIACAIAEGLGPVLAQDASRFHTGSPEAHDALRRGQHQWKSCFAGGWRQAIEHFQYAIERDPRFTRAHVALANVYNFLGFYCLMKPRLAFGVAVKTAERALAIDGALASAHRELALAKFGGEWDWEGSEQSFRRALALDPADPLAHVYYSWLLMLLGRDDAALAEAQKAQGLAPSSRLVAGARAQTLYNGGHYDEAIEICNACIRRSPAYVFAMQVRGLCYLETSARDRAIADLEQATALTDRAPFYVGLLGLCYARLGMRDAALQLIAELDGHPSGQYVPPQCYVYIHAGLGDPMRALEYQERAYEDGAPPFNYLIPSLRDLYALDPRHRERLRQMRLTIGC